MLPYIIGRKKSYAKQLLLLNVFAGWTTIGWVGALIWAVLDDPIKQSQLSPSQNNYTSTEALLVLEKLGVLLSQGFINADEFAQQKSKLLTNQNNAIGISSQNLIALERLSNLHKNDLVTADEFAVQKQKLLGTTTNYTQTTQTKTTNINQFANETNETKETALGTKIALGTALLFVSCIVYFTVNYFYNEQRVVENFLEDLKQTRGFNEDDFTPEFYAAVSPITATPILKDYEVYNSQKFKNGDYFVFATIKTGKYDYDYRYVKFLVIPKGLGYQIKNSYNFLNIGKNTISFPNETNDLHRLTLLSQANFNIPIIASKCVVFNGQTSGNVTITNRCSYPIKNIQLQVQFLNEQQQVLQTDTEDVVYSFDELPVGKSKNITWLHNIDPQATQANIQIINPNL
ncbi:MAG TPA: superinfection immunity protein [Bacteroidia bacterium]|nr:superinfection immunity protein [Bacteroidia bacterium]